MLSNLAIQAVSVLTAGDNSTTPLSMGASGPQPGFLGTLNQALQSVSNTQNQATTAEAGFSAGVPGATLAKALVASDRAEVAWNATVGVRNELVSAYQSIMNMQF
jgi:flagellar hook-basal body complex protein FliE